MSAKPRRVIIERLADCRPGDVPDGAALVDCGDCGRPCVISRVGQGWMKSGRCQSAVCLQCASTAGDFGQIEMDDEVLAEASRHVGAPIDRAEMHRRLASRVAELARAGRSN